ncbi:hypothetical protein [Leucothrix arctica]|uniref:hypothetical protein n=1 Tax=Leucothrix arctica TaxID=1481894 RepID=UPI0011B2491E|nr:hypothetical protein [Leucothrix arctica]
MTEQVDGSQITATYSYGTVESYQYDANCKTLQMTIDNKVTDYQYNALNQLTQLVISTTTLYRD